MKKILVTGGAGFIGSHTIVELFNNGYIPVIIDNFSNSLESAVVGIENIIDTKVKVYQIDCCNKDELEAVFSQESDIEGVIHFAAFKAVGESVKLPLKYYTNNISSTVSLLEVMKKYGVGNLVFSSSCTVYGEPDLLPVSEESPIKKPSSPYANSKQICEEIILDFVRSETAFKAISLRYFNPIGAHPSSYIGELPLGIPNNLVPFVTQTAAGWRDKIVIYGNDYNTHDGTCVRDYIHVVDLAKAHVKALELLNNQPDSNHYDFFNIGTGKGNTVLEVIKTFEKVNNIKLNYVIGPRRDGDIERVFASTNKAFQKLNWKAEESLAQSLKDSWNWQLKLGKKPES